MEKFVPKFGLVAVFDILGYQEFLDKNSVDYQVEVMAETLEKIPEETVNLLNEMFGDSAGSPLSTLVLSDSIIFTIPLIFKDSKKGLSYSPDDTASNFRSWNRMLLASLVFMRKMFDAGFPLRGAITLGHYFSEERWLVGKPLVKAYRETMRQEWSGCILSTDAAIGFEEICDSYGKGRRTLGSFVLKYDVPFKDSVKEERYVCNWAAEKSKEVFLPIEHPREYVLKSFVQHKKALSDKEKAKVDNTESFIWFFKENFQKFADES
jgi:hypothetical protein